MTARRRGGPRLSAPLAILAGFALALMVEHLIALTVLALELAAVALAAGYQAGARRSRRRPAVTRPARLQPRTAPAKTRHGTGGPAGPAAPPDELAALRATLRARADQVSQGIPAPGKPRERSS